jgi:uncharacterized protein YxjI
MIEFNPIIHHLSLLIVHHLVSHFRLLCLQLVIHDHRWIRDKAGGYGLQAKGAALVVGVRGCSYNVIGFPLHSFCQVLLQHLDKLHIQP